MKTAHTVVVAFATALLGLGSLTARAEEGSSRYDGGPLPAGSVWAGHHGPASHGDGYRVLYRRDHHDHWHVRGTYASHHEAHHAADHLRRHGYEVLVDRL